MSTVEQRFVANFNKNPNSIISELDSLVNLGYLKSHINKEYPELTIYNYSEKVTFERHWNAITMAARGLVIDKVALEIRALPFAKFFNVDELKGTHLEELSTYDPTHLFEEFDKMDGSLGIGFVHKNTLMWCTRGDFESDQAKFANKFMNDMFTESHLATMAFEYGGMTILAEIIYPDNRIVVDYGSKKGLVILGMLRNSNGVEMPYYDLLSECRNLELPVVPKYNGMYMEDILEEREVWGKNIEGRVIKFSDGKRLKVKGVEYLRIHKLRYGFSLKMQVELWKEGTLCNYLEELEEEFRPEVETLNNTLRAILVSLDNQVTRHWNICTGMERKEVAFYLNQEALPTVIRTCVFQALDGKHFEQTLRTHIYRNYRKLLKIGE